MHCATVLRSLVACCACHRSSVPGRPASRQPIGLPALRVPNSLSLLFVITDNETQGRSQRIVYPLLVRCLRFDPAGNAVNKRRTYHVLFHIVFLFFYFNFFLPRARDICTPSAYYIPKTELIFDTLPQFWVAIVWGWNLL